MSHAENTRSSELEQYEWEDEQEYHDRLLLRLQYGETNSPSHNEARALFEALIASKVEEARIDERKKFRKTLKEVASDWSGIADLSPISNLHDINNFEIRELKALQSKEGDS